MTRALDAGTATAIAAATGEKVRLIELQFSSGTVRLTTAAQDISWNGQTWEAVGGRLAADGFREAAHDEAPGCRVQLSGVDQSLVATLFSANYRGRKATVYEARLDPSTGAVIGTPLPVFDGYMNEGFDIVETRDEVGGGTVEIETRLTDKVNNLTQLRGVRTNVHSHQREIPGAAGDTFFQHVAGLMGRRPSWGTKDPVDVRRYFDDNKDNPDANPRKDLDIPIIHRRF